MRQMIKIGSLAILTFLGCFTGVAFAANTVAPDDATLLELLEPIYKAFVGGQHLYAGMLALVAAVAIAKRYAPAKVRTWIQGDVGGSVTTLVMSFAGAMATALGSGNPVTWAMAKTATLIAVGAAGGYSLVKKLIVEPFLKPLSKKTPAWMAPIWAIVFWAFDKKTPVEEAEAAGKAAVEAKPAPGAGKVTEID